MEFASDHGSAMQTIDVADDARHRPPAGADGRWQESWFLSWYDPLHRAGGFHHIGLAPLRGTADLWHWVALDGAVAARFHDLRLPIPDDDLPDLQLGPVHVQTKVPLRSYSLRTEHEGFRSEALYESFTEPFEFAIDAPGADIGKGHFESLGQVRATIETSDGTVETGGLAYHDHSWGPREYGALKAHRWACVSFGDDLFASVFSFSTDEGRRDFGYVYDDGAFHGVRAAEFDARVANDGHTPRGCDLRVWTTDGRGYRFVCRDIDVASPGAHNDGFFVTDGFGVFECGGRLGTGLLEINERAAPSPEHRSWLNLD
ncbi:MAG TPA: hypothetical protein VG076_18185 [Acidimicrobiales bacterium]|nr:hypothetical protein [Acidimicrobiales bacterium]